MFKIVITVSFLFTSVAIAQNQDVIELGYEYYATASPFHLGYGIVDVYRKEQGTSKTYYVEPYLKVESKTNKETLTKACGDGDHFNGSLLVNVPFVYFVRDKKVNDEIIGYLNTLPDNRTDTTKVNGLKYIDVSRLELFGQKKDNSWVSLDVVSGRNGSNADHLVNLTSVGKNVVLSDTCGNLHDLYEKNRYLFEWQTKVTTVTGNFISFTFSEFLKSNQLTDLERKESQSGGVLVESRSKKLKSGLSLGFVSTADITSSSSGNTLYTNDNRKRYVNSRYVNNLFSNYWNKFSGTIHINSDDTLISKSMINFMRSAVLPKKKLETFTIDLKNGKFYNDTLKRGLSWTEKKVLKSNASLISERSRKGDAKVAEIKGSFDGKDKFVDENDIVYKHEGNDWVPTSIKLYAISDIDMSNLKQSGLSSYTRRGESYLKTLSRDAYTEGVEHNLIAAEMYQINVAKQIIEVMNNNHKDLVEKIEKYSPGTTFLLKGWWFMEHEEGDADFRSFVNRNFRNDLNNADLFCRHKGFRYAVMADRILDAVEHKQKTNIRRDETNVERNVKSTLINCK